jgi:hypothetical protein
MAVDLHRVKMGLGTRVCVALEVSAKLLLWLSACADNSLLMLSLFLLSNQTFSQLQRHLSLPIALLPAYLSIPPNGSVSNHPTTGRPGDL